MSLDFIYDYWRHKTLVYKPLGPEVYIYMLSNLSEIYQKLMIWLMEIVIEHGNGRMKLGDFPEVIAR